MFHCGAPTLGRRAETHLGPNSDIAFNRRRNAAKPEFGNNRLSEQHWG